MPLGHVAALGPALAALLAVPASPAAAALAVDPSEPAGTTVLLEDAGWSWFEDERAAFSADGERLYVSAVTGTGATAVPPGTVALAEIELGTGERRLVDLGHSELDDHNSASIWEAESGEVTTSWSRHHADQAIRTQRRRTDGSWLRLPPIPTTGRSTYSNLLSSVESDGTTLLYDFYRGARFDPSVLASPDVGRTWIDLGRVLRDPLDGSVVRPYVQYTSDGDGRIHLLATPAHPTSEPTALFAGYVEDGLVHSSLGTVLGPLGSAVPVTALTPVWAPEGDERSWTADITTDPGSGGPVVAFSVRHSAEDHRYWWGRWDGEAWRTEEIAHAGRALTAGQPDYTGLAAIDPRDPNHLVISTDAHPVAGFPLVSGSDGLRHWELWDGRRSQAGTWTWTPITADSTNDNLRPILVAGGGADGMLWLRGAYTTFTAYQLDVVGVVRANGATVAAGPASVVPVTDVLPASPPRAAPANPIVGQLDGHGADDVLLYRAGVAPEDLLLGDDQRHPTPIAAPAVNGTYTPVPGDFDGDGRTDIFWYAPGSATDHHWRGRDIGAFSNRSARQVRGTYTPIPGDFDGDGRTDIFWYAPGTTTDSVWHANPDGTLTPTATRQVRGTYTPIPGDFDGDGRTDIHWYAPGTTTDFLWWSRAGALDSSELAAADL